MTVTVTTTTVFLDDPTKQTATTAVLDGAKRILGISVFAWVYLMEGSVVRKAPCSQEPKDLEPISREATVYAILGNHPRIAECLSGGRTDVIDIKYYPNGDLCVYLAKHRGEIQQSLISKWFRQIIEAVEKIHKHEVIHSDLALRQFFLDDDLNARLGDFNSSQYPEGPALGYEKATHCLPRDYDALNTVESDLFALGSTLYELVVGHPPYDELYHHESEEEFRCCNDEAELARAKRKFETEQQIEARYAKQIFPDVSGIFGGEVILGCWRSNFYSATDVLLHFDALAEDKVTTGD